ncbi:MAG: hypothetical protein NT076_05620 [Candidatus Pacearchaeota archaeon]|nr:hypothetical protein [Candidatus Pacearchaeota archaeon]
MIQTTAILSSHGSEGYVASFNIGIPVRLYQNHCDPQLNDKHDLTTTEKLTWPVYDIFVWYGCGERAVVKNVPLLHIEGVVFKMRSKLKMSGVIGVREVGINRSDAGLIASCGVGVH